MSDKSSSVSTPSDANRFVLEFDASDFGKRPRKKPPLNPRVGAAAVESGGETNAEVTSGDVEITSGDVAPGGRQEDEVALRTATDAVIARMEERQRRRSTSTTSTKSTATARSVSAMSASSKGHPSPTTGQPPQRSQSFVTVNTSHRNGSVTDLDESRPGYVLLRVADEAEDKNRATSTTPPALDEDEGQSSSSWSFAPAPNNQRTFYFIESWPPPAGFLQSPPTTQHHGKEAAPTTPRQRKSSQCGSKGSPSQKKSTSRAETFSTNVAGNSSSIPLIYSSSDFLISASSGAAPKTSSHKFIVLVFSSDFESGNLIQIERIGPYNYQMYTSPDCGNSPLQTNNKQWFHWSVRGLPANALVRITMMGMANSKMYTFGWTPSVATVPLAPSVERQLHEMAAMGGSARWASAKGGLIPPNVAPDDLEDCRRHRTITNTFGVGSRGLSLDLALMDGGLEEAVTKVGIIGGPPEDPTTPFSADTYCAAAGIGLYPVLYTRMSNKYAKVVVTQLKDISMPTPGYPNLGYRQPKVATGDDDEPASPEKVVPEATNLAASNPHEDDHDQDPRPRSRPHRGNVRPTILVGNVADEPDPTGEGGLSNQALGGGAVGGGGAVDDGINCFSNAVDKFSAEHERISAVTIIPPSTLLGDSSTEVSVAEQVSTPTSSVADSHTPPRSNSPPCTMVNVVGGTVEVLEQGAGRVHTDSSRVQRFLDQGKQGGGGVTSHHRAPPLSLGPSADLQRPTADEPPNIFGVSPEGSLLGNSSFPAVGRGAALLAGLTMGATPMYEPEALSSPLFDAHSSTVHMESSSPADGGVTDVAVTTFQTETLHSNPPVGGDTQPPIGPEVSPGKALAHKKPPAVLIVAGARVSEIETIANGQWHHTKEVPPASPVVAPASVPTKPKFPPSYSLSFELKGDVPIPFIPTGSIEMKGLELAVKQHLQHHVSLFPKGADIALAPEGGIRKLLPPISPYQLGHGNCPATYVAGALPYSYGRMCRHLLQWRRQVLSFNENLRMKALKVSGEARAPSVGVPCPILLNSPYDVAPSYVPSSCDGFVIPDNGIYYNEELLCKSLDGHDVHLLTITGVTSQMNADFEKLLAERGDATGDVGRVDPKAYVESLLQDSTDAYHTAAKLRDVTFSVLPQEDMVEDGATIKVPASPSCMRPIAFSALPEQRFTSMANTDCTESLGDDSVPPPNPPGSFRKFFIVFTCRVHPGETPANYMLHGSLDFFLHPTDPRAAQLRATCVLIVVPMINPDGVARGHSRVDANGVDLNRMYKNPSFAQNPAPYCLRGMLLKLASGEMPPMLRGSPWGATPPPPLPSSVPKQLKRLHLFVDMHAHANKRGTFFYGNSMNASHMARSLLYSKLVALNSPYFEFPACNFSEANMFAVGRSGKSKDLSSRVTIFQDSGVVHIYTIEANYVAGSITNWVPDVPVSAKSVSASLEPSLLRSQLRKQRGASDEHEALKQSSNGRRSGPLPLLGTYGRVFVKLAPNSNAEGAEGALALVESTAGALIGGSSPQSNHSIAESLNDLVETFLGESLASAVGPSPSEWGGLHEGMVCTVSSNAPGAERTQVLTDTSAGKPPSGCAANPKAGTKYDTHALADIGRALLVGFLDLSSATPPSPHLEGCLHAQSRLPLSPYKSLPKLHASISRFILFDAFEAMRKQIMLRCKLTGSSFFEVMGIGVAPKKASSSLAAAKAAALKKAKPPPDASPEEVSEDVGSPAPLLTFHDLPVVYTHRGSKTFPPTTIHRLSTLTRFLPLVRNSTAPESAATAAELSHPLHPFHTPEGGRQPLTTSVGSAFATATNIPFGAVSLRTAATVEMLLE